MDTSDEMDIFATSCDEETNPRDGRCEAGISSFKSENRNPVKEHLLKQLNEVEERVERTKRQIEETKLVKEKILRKFSSRYFYGDSSSSDSESDLITASGEPIVKRKRRSKRPRKQPLIVKGNWQHVIDDKWIVGIVLENTIAEDLERLDIQVMIKGLNNYHGISSFWTKDSKLFWRRTDIAKSGLSNEVAATVIFDLPKFSTSLNVEIFGVVTYELEDQSKYQTLIPKLILNLGNIINNKHNLNVLFSKLSNNDLSALDSNVQAIISAKSLAVEKIIVFKNSQPFVEEIEYVFNEIQLIEIFPKVFICKNGGPLDRCIIELTSVSSKKYRTIIYSRSIAQLNMLLQLLNEVFQKGTSINCRNVNAEDVIEAFETELDMYKKTGNNFELQKAVVNTDLMIKEFENGCSIYTVRNDE